MDYDLGFFDQDENRVEPAQNPFIPKVLPMSSYMDSSSFASDLILVMRYDCDRISGLFTDIVDAGPKWVSAALLPFWYVVLEHSKTYGF